MGVPGADGELQYGLDELEAKAKELETKRVPTVGGTPEKVPDKLAITALLWDQLKVSGEKMDNTFRAGDVEARRLANAHRGAANAYKSIQQQATEALGQEMNGPAAAPASMDAATPNIGDLQSEQIVSEGFPTGSARAKDEMDWDEAAAIIHGGDDPHALSLKYFRDQWQVYPGTLTDYRKIFAKPANGWTGGASETCKAAMASLDSWWDNMGAECGRLTQEATTFADAHDKLLADHPTMNDVKEFQTADWEALGAQIGRSADEARQMMWEDFQRASEDALDTYAATHLSEIRPGKPPAISGLQAVHKGELPKKPEQAGAPGEQSGPGGPGTNGVGDAGSPKMPEVPSVSPGSMDSSGGEQPGGSPGSGGGSPSGGGQGGGTPSGGGAPSGGTPSGLPKGTEGMPEMPGLGEPSLKPASAGGGGGGGMGGGGGGMPSMPLGPAVGADSVAASPAGARGVGGGAPGAPGGAGMGGMGGGMGGMGGGHGQGQGKEKRRNPNLSEDEDLYKEDRAYTEAVIGRRARKDAKE